MKQSESKPILILILVYDSQTERQPSKVFRPAIMIIITTTWSHIGIFRSMILNS